MVGVYLCVCMWVHDGIVYVCVCMYMCVCMMVCVHNGMCMSIGA